MTAHVIQLLKLPSQVEELIKILKDYKAEWSSVGEILYTHDFDNEIKELQNFKNNFELLIYNYAISEEKDTDKYGNTFSPNYEYAEITFFDSGAELFNTVRLLGNDPEQGRKRYYIENLYHTFSPTTLSLITNMREIVKTPFNIKHFQDLSGQPFRESNVSSTIEKSEIKTRYTWQETAQKFFIPEAKTKKFEQLIDEELDTLVARTTKPSLDKSEIYRRNSKIKEEKKRILEKSQKEIQKEKSLVEKIKEDLEEQKRKTENQKILNTIGSFVDRYSFACLVKEAFKCVRPSNVSCEVLFKDLSVNEIFDRLAAVFPRGSESFQQLEKLVEKTLFGEVIPLRDEVDALQKTIEAQEKALDCLKCEGENLQAIRELELIIEVNKRELEPSQAKLKAEEERIYADLQLSERQRQLANQKGNLFAIISTAVTDGEKAGLVTNTDRVLKVIDTIIPLEDLYSLLIQGLAGTFDPKSFNFPELRPVNDIFAGFAAEISQAFISLILKAIMILIETMLNELFNSDNLDSLIASSLSPESSGPARNFGVYGDLVNLFGGNTQDSQQIIDNNFENFWQAISPHFGKAIDIKTNQNKTSGYIQKQIGIPGQLIEDSFAVFTSKQDNKTQQIGSLVSQEVNNDTLQNKINSFLDSFRTNRKGVLDFIAIQQSTDFTKWNIDFSGEKFVITNNIRPLEIQEIDKTINSLSREAADWIFPGMSLSEAVDKLFSLPPPAPLAEPSVIESELSVGQQQVKNEMSTLLRDLVSISSPTEVIKLLAGKASDSTLDIASEIIKSRNPILSKAFSNKNNISNLFKQLGISSGLDSLLPQMELLANVPGADSKVVPPKLCAPFDNVDSFRKSLLTRTASPEVVDRVFENLNKEKIKKYNQLVDTILTISTGNIPENVFADPRAKFLNDVKNNILTPAIEQELQQNERVSDKKSAQDAIRDLMNEKMNSSPIYKSMTDTALSSVFNPIRDAFRNDMEGYIESLSTTKDVQKKVKRKIKFTREIEVKKDNGQTTTEEKTEVVINPEFKELLNAGLVPIVEKDDSEFAVMANKNGLEVDGEGKLDDLRVSGNPNTDFLKPSWMFKRLFEDPFSLGFESPDRVKKPVLKTVKKRIVGDSFKNDIKKGLIDNLIVDLDRNLFSIKIADFKSTNSQLPDILEKSKIAKTFDPYPMIKQQLENNLPKWSISFDEIKQGQREITKMSVQTSGLSVNPINGFEDFYRPTSEIRKSFLVEQNNRNIIVNKFNSPEYPLKTRVEVFEEFISNRLKEGLANTQDLQRLQQSIKNECLGKQKEIIKTATSQMVEALIKTRLFETTNIGSPESDQKLIFLQLFDFARDQTEQEKVCKFDPNIMDFSSLYNKFREIYQNEPEVKQAPKRLNGLNKKRTRIGNATYKLMTDVTVRLLVVDFVLKTLPIFDSFLYTKEFSSIPFMKDVLSNHVSGELEKMGIYDSFKREFKQQIAQGPENIKPEYLERTAQQIDCRDVNQMMETTSDSQLLRQRICEDCEDNNNQEEVQPQVQSRTQQPGQQGQQQAQQQVASSRSVGEQEFKSQLDSKIEEHLNAVLDKLAEIFYIPQEERNGHQFKKFFINATPIYDIHDSNETKFTEKVKTFTQKYELKKEGELYQKIQEAKQKIEETPNISRLEKLIKINETLGSLANDTTKIQASWVSVEEEKEEIKQKIKQGDFLFERYVKIGKVTQNFRSQAAFRNLVLAEESVMSIEKFQGILNSITNKNVKLYDCDLRQAGLLEQAPEYGLRFSYVYNKFENKFYGEPYKFFVDGKTFNLRSDKVNKLREHTITEKVDDNKHVDYNLIKIADQQIKLDTKITIKQALEINSTATYEKVFLPILKERILSTEEMSVMFDYCIPLREVSVFTLMHTFLVNNNENSKFLFEPTKNVIKNIFSTLDESGDKTNTSSKLQDLRAMQIREAQNEGNPGGPMNFEALKIFLRTPIHIIKGMSSTVDPNLFITDKIVAGAAIAGSLSGQKIYIPYSLTSLALLPFPVFTPPPVGIIPPLTAYNIGMIIGPIFLALEFLLFDLPWFKNLNTDPNSQTTQDSLRAFGIDPNARPCQDQGQIQDGQAQREIIIPIEAETIEEMLEKIKKACNDR